MKKNKKICCIYKIINVVNNKYYLGSSTNFKSRVTTHKSALRRNKHVNFKLQNAYNKYGEESFIFKVFKICKKKDLIKMEQKFLDKMDFKKTYNISGQASGGDLLKGHPEKDKIRKKCTQRLLEYNRSPENSARLKKMIGDKNPNFGNKWNEKTRKKVSLIVKKRLAKMSKEEKELMIAKSTKGLRKFWDSPQGTDKRKLLSKKSKGKNNPFYGKKHSKKTKDKIREKNTGKQNIVCWLKVTIEGIDYNSLGEASRKLKVPCPTVCYRLKSLNPKFKNWNYFGQKKQVVEIVYKVSVKYKVKSKIYRSITEASKELKLSSSALVFRAKSTNPKWKDYELLREPKKKRKKKSRVAHLSPRKRTKTRTQTSI